MSNPLHFNMSGTHYNVSLTPTEQHSLKSVMIGGINYTIRGQEDAIVLFERKTRGLNLASMTLEELKDRCSILEDTSANASIAKLNQLVTDILPAKEAANQAIQSQSKRSKILYGLRPTWPIPNTPQLASIIDRMEKLGVYGARIAVINQGKLEWSKGFKELEQPGLMIQAASISKTIHALILLSLIQEGVKTPSKEPLTLDTNIQDILDKELWKLISNGYQDPITIRQLMSHTAGLEGESRTGYRGYYRDSKAEVAKIDEQIHELTDKLDRSEKKKTALSNKPDIIANIGQEIERLKKAREKAEQTAKGELPTVDQILKGEGTNSPPARVTSTPGSQYAYSGSNAMILQKVIEVIAGNNNDLANKTYEEIVKEKVFDKLGMEHSTFSVNAQVTAKGYGEDGKLVPGDWMQQPELAAAGLWTTPEDLAKVAIAIQKSLLNQEGRIIEQHLARQMLAPADAVLKTQKEILVLEDKLKTAQRHVKYLKERRDHVKKGSSGRAKKTHLNEHIQVHKERLQKIQAKLDGLLSSQKEIPGLGVFVEQTNEATYFYHSGSNLGFRCLMVANDQGQGAVVMTNSELGDDLIPEVIRKIAEVYDWKGKNYLNLQFPSLHPEVVETSQKHLEVQQGEKWAHNYKGQYISRQGAIVSVEVNKEGEILFRPPDHPTGIKITPVSKHVGIIKENGRWFPLEFTQTKKDEPWILNIHGMRHAKLKKTNQ